MSTITIKGVDCFGAMSEYATVMLQCEWANGEEFEQMYLGSKGFTTWSQLVNYYIQGGKDEGYIILECESDE